MLKLRLSRSSFAVFLLFFQNYQATGKLNFIFGPKTLDFSSALDSELKEQKLQEAEQKGYQNGVLLAEHTLTKDLVEAKKLALALAKNKVDLSCENSVLKSRLEENLRDLQVKNIEMFNKVKTLQAELSMTKTSAGTIAQGLVEKIKTHQTDSFFKLDILRANLRQSEEKLKTQSQAYQDRLGQLVCQITEQKKLHNQLQENFIKVKQMLEVTKLSNPTLTVELSLKTRENHELAAKVAKREKAIASLSERKKALEKQISNYLQERSLLQASIDQMYKSNGKLLSKNESLELFLKDKEHEIAGKVQKLATLERQHQEFQQKIDSLRKKLEEKDPNRFVKAAADFSHKLAKATAEQSELKEQIKKLMNQIDQAKLHHKELLSQALQDKERVKQLQEQLSASNNAIANLRASHALVMRKIGIETEDPELSVTFLRQASKSQMRDLYTQVVYKGKAFLDESLRKTLENEALTKALVDDLEKRLAMSKSSTIDSSFVKIFSSLENNNLKASFSKLYTHFLAKNCAGFSDQHNFDRFKDLAKEYFKNNLISLVELKDLSDPSNYILMSLV